LGFLSKESHSFLTIPIHATCPVHFIPPDLIYFKKQLYEGLYVL
jgi:hypothetical protein